MMKMRHKKGGIVTNVVMGVGGLVIGVIVILIITSTLLDANLLEKTTATTTGETGAWLNITNYTVSNSAAIGFAGLTITGANNYTGATPTAVLVANFTVSGSTITNSSDLNYANLTINYTYTIDSGEEKSVDNLEANFTDGIGNISSKIPTILLIVAVVFLFGALVLLVRNAQTMGIGGSGGGSL